MKFYRFFPLMTAVAGMLAVPVQAKDKDKDHDKDHDKKHKHHHHDSDKRYSERRYSDRWSHRPNVEIHLGDSDRHYYRPSPVYVRPRPVYIERPVYVERRSYSSYSLEIDVQRGLSRRGYYGGPIDGDIGPGTRSAIRAYQADHGLPITGRIDRDLLDSLL